MDEFDSLTESVFLVEPKRTGSIKAKGKKADLKGKTSQLHLKLDGFQQLQDVDEPWEATEIRHALFNKEWELMSSRIEDVMLKMNAIVLSAIYRFVESAYTPLATRAVMPVQELPAGLIFAGINVPDHDLMFQQIARTLTSPTEPTMESLEQQSKSSYDKLVNEGTSNHVVILQSKDCTNLKSALKCMIEQFLGLGVAGTINPLEGGMKLQNYDMVVLERWYQSILELHHEQRDQRPALVVIIQDFESFDQDTLQDLITICSNYQDRIPFVLLLGLATSIDALHQGLPKSVLSLLRTKTFLMQQSSECLTAIVEDLFIHANVGLMVGPLPLKQLIDQFIHYNFSVGGFVSNLKYVVMHHYYANPLSILCDRSLTAQSRALELLGKGHYDHIRMLPSFQQYVESKVESDSQTAEMLLMDDEFLALQIPDLANDLQEYHRNFAFVFDFLWFLQSRFPISVLKKSKRALYFMALDGSLTTSSTLTFLLGLIRKLNSNDMMLFVEDWLQVFKQAPRCTLLGSPDQENAMEKELLVIQSIRDRMVALLDVVSEDSVTSSSEIEDNDATGEGSDRVQNIPQRMAKGRPQRGTQGNSTFVKKRKLISLKANDTESRQTKIAKKSRDTARLPKGALGAYTLLVTEVDETIARILRTYLDCHTRMPLNEIFYYSQAFLPQPRASIQTALGQPELYLNCTCCHPPKGTERTRASLADMVLPTQHDTCILYKLYVECGRLINMYDWFTAFGMILERGLKKDQDNNGDKVNGTKSRGPKGKPKATAAKRASTEEKESGLDQKEIQARFISGVAELQFMGFIKPTNRKTDHVMRLTWGNI
ncbi:Origin recognition complex subunit 3 [Mortierella alpina]|uniref:Origin recognition complex subunit 3 n=1 Tax=Mortierella alpina TaxID=64518 RepID=A0A9P6M4J9_MORAP|nr:Origin recognition complex subunit 3 [Mortierella alpina]